MRPEKIVKVVVQNGWGSSATLKPIVQSAERLKLPIATNDSQLSRLGKTHQGIALEVIGAPVVDWENLQNLSVATVIVIDHLEDPHNLGAILRTCWLMGVLGVFVPLRRAVGITPSVAKVASGGCEHIPVQFCSSLLNTLRELQKLNFWILGLDNREGQSLWKARLPAKKAWVIGSEFRGLSSPIAQLCDSTIHIEQVTGSSESLNVSVALGMALGETFRQLKLTQR